MTLQAHKSPQAMARCLVSYIDCDVRVQREIRTEFQTAPGLHTIARIRAERAKPAPQYTGFVERGWDWRGDQHRDLMAKTSRKFVAAIASESGAKKFAPVALLFASRGIAGGPSFEGGPA